MKKQFWILLLFSLVWNLFSLQAQSKPVREERGTAEKSESKLIQGVWEQVTQKQKVKLVDMKDRGFRIVRMVRIFDGDKAITVQHAGHAGYVVEVHSYSINAKGPKSISFYDSSKKSAAQCLYELHENRLSICWLVGKNPTELPRKFEPSEDGGVIDAFNRVSPSESKLAHGPDAQSKKILSGLWSATFHMHNGVQLDKDPTSSFEVRGEFARRHIILHFSDNKFTLIEASKSEMSVTHGIYGATTNEPHSSIDFPLKDNKLVPGIFDVQGDSLLLCINRMNAIRPTQFQANLDDPNEVVMFKRIVSKQKQ